MNISTILHGYLPNEHEAFAALYEAEGRKWLYYHLWVEVITELAGDDSNFCSNPFFIGVVVLISSMCRKELLCKNCFTPQYDSVRSLFIATWYIWSLVYWWIMGKSFCISLLTFCEGKILPLCLTVATFSGDWYVQKSFHSLAHLWMLFLTSLGLWNSAKYRTKAFQIGLICLVLLRVVTPKELWVLWDTCHPFN